MKSELFEYNENLREESKAALIEINNMYKKSTDYYRSFVLIDGKKYLKFEFEGRLRFKYWVKRKWERVKEKFVQSVIY